MASTPFTKWIWDQAERWDLSMGARMTLFAISEHMNLGEHEHYHVYPSQERLAGMVNCTDKTLRKYLQELQDAELVVMSQGGSWRTNFYWLNLPDYEVKA